MQYKNPPPLATTPCCTYSATCASAAKRAHRCSDSACRPGASREPGASRSTRAAPKHDSSTATRWPRTRPGSTADAINGPDGVGGVDIDIVDGSGDASPDE